jgi:triosephosphate isomerase
MKKLVIGNLKMNVLSAKERMTYCSLMKKELGVKKLKESELIICPPFIHIEAFGKISKKIKVGAQDVFAENSGSYTGEISPLMLKNFGCEYVIVGHSERRRYFSENNHEINLKVSAVLKNGLRPILCIGESLTEKDEHKTLKVITTQVKESLLGVSNSQIEQVVIAYEPIWAVGTDVTPKTNEVMEARLLIKKILVDLYGSEIAEKVGILYGGNVTAQNVSEVCLRADMDGVLIGRESLHPHQFVKIAEIINEAKK